MCGGHALPERAAFGSVPLRAKLAIMSFLLGVFVLAPVLLVQAQVRVPRGIYAVVNVEDEINSHSAATAAQLDADFNTLYQSLLSNPAISGLTLQVHWDTLNPNPPGAANSYYWNYVDDAFNQAAAWNMQNPANAPKNKPLPRVSTLPGRRRRLHAATSSG